MASAIELDQFFQRMKELWPEVKVDNAWANEWLRNFRDCPLEVLNRALEEHARTSRFKPGLSDIYEQSIKIAGGRFRKPGAQDSAFVRKWSEAMRDNGKVHTGKWGWKPKDQCVYHKRMWKPKIEFLMDVLGGDAVTQELRELFDVKSEPEWKAVRLVYEAMKKPENRSKYERKIEDLVTHAKYFEGMLKQEAMSL